MKVFTAALLLIFSIMLHYSCAVSPADCNAIEPLATKAVDLINIGRRNGYLFQLLRVADAHLNNLEFATVYYLVLDVKESDCPARSGKQWDDCEPAVSRRPSDLVIGQCKVVATTRLNEPQDLRVDDFNCTTSSVSSALANTKDSPVLFDYIEDTELFRKQTDKALEKYKKENVDFASFRVDQVERVVRVVFGFCRADLSYDAGTSDMETPEDFVINCEVFNLQKRKVTQADHCFKQELLHHCPLQDVITSILAPMRPMYPLIIIVPMSTIPLGTILISIIPMDTLPMDTLPMDTIPMDTLLMDIIPMDTLPMDPLPKHHPHGPPPHGHPPHGHPPPGPPPHGHDFHDYGPCDPLPLSQSPPDHHRWGHGPPPRHSGKRGPGKGHGPFKWRHVKYIYRLPPLMKGEVLPLPEANFPIFSLPDRRNPLKPEIQPFPQSASESCPGVFNSEFPQLSQFFAYTFLKEKSEFPEK
ncbi:Histidine-rich glycoprotein [Pteropus alecto]|uniref:Histidine-rich glycoprotein n=1 Tax=Pteropus alecto TaxID=9402 RepID=L5JRM3_PTEAL|nr:Histidine-rich glycoprotein [Pteropus alecto]